MYLGVATGFKHNTDILSSSTVDMANTLAR